MKPARPAVRRPPADPATRRPEALRRAARASIPIRAAARHRRAVHGSGCRTTHLHAPARLHAHPPVLRRALRAVPFFFTRYFEWPGNLFAAGLGSLFGAIGLGAIGNLFWARRDTAAFRRAARNQPLRTARWRRRRPHPSARRAADEPVRGRPCVAYEYEVSQPLPRQSGRRRQSDRHRRVRHGRLGDRHATAAAFGCSAFRCSTSSRSPATPGPDARGARPPVRCLGAIRGCAAGALQMFAAFDDALADADGVVRKDFRMTEEPIPFEHRTFRRARRRRGAGGVRARALRCGEARAGAERGDAQPPLARHAGEGPPRRSSRPRARRPCSGCRSSR